MVDMLPIDADVVGDIEDERAQPATASAPATSERGSSEATVGRLLVSTEGMNESSGRAECDR
jgi:hypothetical protein